MTVQQTLFPEPVRPRAVDWPRPSAKPPAPSAPATVPGATQRDGLRDVAPRAGGLDGMALALFRSAGPVVTLAGRAPRGGFTIGELAVTLTECRGAQVKESTTCAVIDRLRRRQLVRDSGFRRRGPSGVGCIVWTATTFAAATT